MAVRDVAQALALLRERRVLTLTDQPGLVSLVSAVAGERVPGSWWGHPAGKRIYAIASALEDHVDVLACKLAGGKATFVHRSLWPPLVRVVTDAGWRKKRLAALPARAARLVARIGRRDVRLDKKALPPRDRNALERSALVMVTSEHTETGAHATVLRSWSSWASSDVKRAARELDLEPALASLASCGLRL